VVLGVRRDTTREDLRAAYELARSKYDEDSVAHLSDEVQQLFREKALAVDRAYQMLAG
jgi:preprotein translocase subunit Sec63